MHKHTVIGNAGGLYTRTHMRVCFSAQVHLACVCFCPIHCALDAKYYAFTFTFRPLAMCSNLLAPFYTILSQIPEHIAVNM